MHRPYTILSLGDSYTIGESVLLHQSFPYQVISLLRKKELDMAGAEIIAKTGWTTNDLDAAMAEHTLAARYDFVTLLIGVNNQYQGLDIILYKEQFENLLKKSIQLVHGKKEHVIVLSIPDYSVTPFAKARDTEKITKEIDAYNSLNKALSIQYKVQYIDITEGSRQAVEDSDLIAADGLHPSAKEYSHWAEKIADNINARLKK